MTTARLISEHRRNDRWYGSLIMLRVERVVFGLGDQSELSCGRFEILACASGENDFFE